MKIEDYGEFVLDTEQKRVKLKMGANLISIQENVLYLDKITANSKNRFLINIDREQAHLINIQGDIDGISFNDNMALLYDNSSFIAGETKIIFHFIYSDDQIEAIVDGLMDGLISFPIDKERAFYSYARKLNITDKKAISNVMAAIDIPEIDQI